MTTHEDDQAFASAAAKKLRAEETEVSPEISERLIAARRAAIREMESRAGARPFSGTRWLVPA
ncbi:MAG TPA: DUF3619 family protein, partial [Woeseiaceae bacterium]|nr:DUF3619 family protein [Woeseiaceae bacterium]